MANLKNSKHDTELLCVSATRYFWTGKGCDDCHNGGGTASAAGGGGELVWILLKLASWSGGGDDGGGGDGGMVIYNNPHQCSNYQTLAPLHFPQPNKG